jgi:hypothetical protein
VPEPGAHEIVAAYLAVVDRAVPGLVQGLYLTDWVALSDFRVGASDIDFVAVTAPWSLSSSQQAISMREGHVL